ncbi:hypothetical protein NP233_g1397 [Leucocoprinus birnbaumii]|uniref:Uncharacterized protein n=1 Tax=Leucocoprinus birnbaumii TaxID=56174 RepID=A0AAD5YZL0_9AGAR|nr:hypothetical protein NP233_g1397 [Leucocoprinus birnbaumii]
MSALDGPCIPANPDISGLGVRIAVYIQNFLSLVPAYWALRDGQVTPAELETLEKQSVTILITAFAILITALLQTGQKSISNYHATIILNLSWMNNTNTFIYVLLHVHHKYSTFQRNFKEKKGTVAQIPRFKARYLLSDWQKEVFILGSLHLTLMAILGIWLWSQPDDFGDTTSVTCPDRPSVLGPNIQIISVPYRLWSLVIYGLILPPGLNMILPASFFLLLYHACQKLVDLTRRRANPTIEAMTLSIALGLITLFLIDACFVALTEAQIRFNAALVEPGDTDWTFGQILAILLLFVPLHDLVDTLLEKNSKKLGELLLSLCRLDDHLVASYLIDLDKSENTPIILAAMKNRYQMVATLAKKGAALDAPGDRLGYIANAIQHWPDREEGTRISNVTNGRSVMSWKKDHPYRLIHWAAQCGAWGAVDTLASQNQYDVDAPDHLGRRPVHLAAERGFGRVVLALANHHANLDQPDSSGKRPIHLAVKEGRRGVVVALFLAGADLRAPSFQHLLKLAKENKHRDVENILSRFSLTSDRSGESLIRVAVVHRYKDVVEILAESGTDMNVTISNEGRQSIHLAVEKGFNEIVDILERHEADLTAAGPEQNLLSEVERVARIIAPRNRKTILSPRDREGQQPIHLALQNRKHEMAEKLICSGADVNTANRSCFDQTAAHLAAKQGFHDILSLLATKGANLKKPDAEGQHPIHLAVEAEQGSLEAVMSLSEKGVKLNSRNNKNGYQPIHLAAEKGLDPIVEFLVDKLEHADLRAQTQAGQEPIHLAAREGHDGVIKILAKHGVDIKSEDPQGQQPIHLAAQNGHLSAIKALADLDADLQVANRDSKLPIQLAQEFGKQEVVVFLQNQISTRLNTKGRDLGNSPF